MVDPISAAAVSAGVNVANFVLSNSVNAETDSALLSKLQDFSKSNAILGSINTSPISSDSPTIQCLIDVLKSEELGCQPGVAHVFYSSQSSGKSSAARFFCRMVLSGMHRSIYVSGAGGQSSYFQRVAANLGVNFEGNWARCLVSAMTASPNSDKSEPPFLLLDEFNQVTEQDIREFDSFMRACENKGFYLIIITSNEDVANKLVALNAWKKIRPLQSVHDGPATNIVGEAGYAENKVPTWKTVQWTPEQLRKVIKIHLPNTDFDNFDFIKEGMVPTDALDAARKVVRTREAQASKVKDQASAFPDLSAG